jgi:hypothetical protein
MKSLISHFVGVCKGYAVYIQGDRIWKKGPFNPIEIEVEIGSKRFSFLFWAEL